VGKLLSGEVIFQRRKVYKKENKIEYKVGNLINKEKFGNQ
jgi:hypothetical protein